MEEIKAHPWFLGGLPRGALDMNDFYLQAPPFLEQVCPRPSPSALPVAQVLPALVAWRLPLDSLLRREAYSL